MGEEPKFVRLLVEEDIGPAPSGGRLCGVRRATAGDLMSDPRVAALVQAADAALHSVEEADDFETLDEALAPFREYAEAFEEVKRG